MLVVLFSCASTDGYAWKNQQNEFFTQNSGQIIKAKEACAYNSKIKKAHELTLESAKFFTVRQKKRSETKQDYEQFRHIKSFEYLKGAASLKEKSKTYSLSAHQCMAEKGFVKV